MPPRTEEEELRHLMAGYQGGHEAAIEELVVRLSPRLLSFFSADVLGGDAQDLLQECWLRIHRSRHTYRVSEPLLPWVYAIARHTLLDGRRRGMRRHRREVLVPEVPEQAGRAAEPAGTPDVSRLLERLPPSQREVILLLKVSGMTLEPAPRPLPSAP
jgi:RNA polymerase sigma-70 factor (ECF subfamily)